MCLHRHNIGTLRETVNLLASLGLVHLKMNVASPTGRWKNETEHFITQDEANQAILDYIPQYIEDGMPLSVQFCGLLDFDREHRRIQIPSRKYSGIAGAEKQLACGAVRDSMYISPKGRILPCMTMGGTAADPLFDSIFEKSLEEILSESYYRDTCLLKMGACIEHNEKYRDCQYRLACGEWDDQFQYCTENHYRRIYPRDGSDAGFPDCAASVEEGSHCGTNDACGQSAVVYTGFRVDCLMLNCTKAWK